MLAQWVKNFWHTVAAKMAASIVNRVAFLGDSRSCQMVF